MPPSSTQTRPSLLPDLAVHPLEASLFDLSGLSLELILVVLDQVVETGAGLTPLGGERLRVGIAYALGGDLPAVQPVPGSRDATAELSAGLTAAEVRQLRNSLAGVLCAAPVTLF